MRVEQSKEIERRENITKTSGMCLYRFQKQLLGVSKNSMTEHRCDIGYKVRSQENILRILRKSKKNTWKCFEDDIKKCKEIVFLRFKTITNTMEGQ